MTAPDLMCDAPLEVRHEPREVTEAPSWPQVRQRLSDEWGRLARSRMALWVAFAVVHFTIVVLNLHLPGSLAPLGDVSKVYYEWMELLEKGVWIGIDRPWVYPILAIVPMAAAMIFGMAYYSLTWLLLMTAGDAVLFAVLLGRRTILRGRCVTAWWWLAFLLLLGPIALGRIDAATIPVVFLGMLLLAKVPRVAAALIVVGAWIKVWPAAVYVALVMAVRRRSDALSVGFVISGIVVLGCVFMGAGSNVVSFITAQVGRSLQLESPIALPWVWAAALHSRDVTIRFSTDILTFEVIGPGVTSAAAFSTVVMVVLAAVAVLLGLRAVRRDAATFSLLAGLSGALVLAFILGNKVGSPQYVAWIAVPIGFGLIVDRRHWRAPAILGLITALFTQIVYPFGYDYLIDARVGMVLMLTVKVFTMVQLYAWLLWELWRLGNPPSVETVEEPAEQVSAEEAVPVSAGEAVQVSADEVELVSAQETELIPTNGVANAGGVFSSPDRRHIGW